MAVVVPIISQFDSRGINKAINDFKKLDGAGNKATYAFRTVDKAATTALKNIAKFGAVVGVASAVIGKQLVDAGSALEESMSKVNVVFGQSSQAVVKFADDAAKNLGISKQAALEATGTYGNLFQAFGVGQKPPIPAISVVFKTFSPIFTPKVRFTKNPTKVFTPSAKSNF